MQGKKRVWEVDINFFFVQKLNEGRIGHQRLVSENISVSDCSELLNTCEEQLREDGHSRMQVKRDVKQISLFLRK
jgi:hypothetical protein